MIRSCPRTLVLALSACLAAGACSRPSAPAADSGGNGAPPASKPAADATVSGIDRAGMDTSAKPGDDFNAYANGTWDRQTQIPDDRSSTGAFYRVYELAERRTADLIKGIASDDARGDARKIADYYAAFMDEDGIEQRGLAPLQPALDAVAAIATPADLSRYLGGSVRADTDPLNASSFATDHLFGLFVAQGLTDPSRNVATLMQGGLGMPDREYYLAQDEAMAGNREAYRAYIARLLALAGTPEAEAKAKAAAIFALETKIARAHASVLDTQDVHKAGAPWKTADLGKRAPGIDWPAFLDAAGLRDEQAIVAWQPDATRKLSALVASEPLPAWKDYLHFHAIDHSAALLPAAFAQASFDFHGKTLTGTPKQRERWKRAVAATSQDLGDAVGQLYVKRYFPAPSKAQVEAMVRNILDAFRDGVDELDWMTAQTRDTARAKAEAMRVSVGYPETWRDYATLDVRRDDPLGNRLRAEQAEYRHQLAKLGKAPDRAEWWMTPQTVNAVQLPLQNAMNFPAAILEAPFFDPKADPAANYGAIGAVIGHEISHGFDDTGAEFDAQGRLHNWWTPGDTAHFKAATAKLVKQYDAYEPLPGLHINGEQTLGENIADVSGLQAAYAAYRKSLGGKDAPVIDGMTGDQRFFLAYAQAWRTKTREAALRAQVIGDGHAPGDYRALTVRNIDAWYPAFDVAQGQKLYLPEDRRVRIW